MTHDKIFRNQSLIISFTKSQNIYIHEPYIKVRKIENYGRKKNKNYKNLENMVVIRGRRILS